MFNSSGTWSLLEHLTGISTVEMPSGEATFPPADAIQMLDSSTGLTGQLSGKPFLNHQIYTIHIRLETDLLEVYTLSQALCIFSFLQISKQMICHYTWKWRLSEVWSYRSSKIQDDKLTPISLQICQSSLLLHRLPAPLTSNTFSAFPNTDKATQHSSSLKGISPFYLL